MTLRSKPSEMKFYSFPLLSVCCSGQDILIHPLSFQGKVKLPFKNCLVSRYQGGNVLKGKWDAMRLGWLHLMVAWRCVPFVSWIGMYLFSYVQNLYQKSRIAPYPSRTFCKVLEISSACRETYPYIYRYILPFVVSSHHCVEYLSTRDPSARRKKEKLAQASGNWEGYIWCWADRGSASAQRQ